MEYEKFSAIIMAGGLGKRMKSDLPKVLHKVGPYPMLVHVIKNVQQINPKHIFVIVGQYKNIIQETLLEYDIDDVIFIQQDEPLGTGHAIQCAVDDLRKIHSHKVLVLNGDNPLVSSETMKNMVLKTDMCKIMTCILEEQRGSGRIILDEISHEFDRIVEEKDCTEEQKLIKRVNAGVYVFNKLALCHNIMKLNNNNVQNEYYLTDVVELIKNNELCKIDMYLQPVHKNYELLGVNNQEQLQELNDIYNQLNTTVVPEETVEPSI